jgi:hypothetical protein
MSNQQANNNPTGFGRILTGTGGTFGPPPVNKAPAVTVAKNSLTPTNNKSAKFQINPVPTRKL